MHKRLLSLIIQEGFYFLLMILWQIVLDLHSLKKSN